MLVTKAPAFKADYTIYCIRDGNYRIVDSNLLPLLTQGTPAVAAPDQPIFIDHSMLHRVAVCGEVHQHEVLAHNEDDSSVTNSIMSEMWT